MALDYDGADDVVDHGDIAVIDGASALTFGCWLWIDTSEANGGILCKSSGGGILSFSLQQWYTAPTDRIGCFFGYSAVNGGYSTTALVTGAWHHWMGVFNGGGVGNAGRQQLYLDGVAETLTFVGTVPATLPDSGAATVQSGFVVNGATTTYYDCKIALVKIWTAALAAAEVAQEMNSYRPVRTANLILGSPYDDGTSARDYSGNGNHGTVTGALQAAGPPVSYGGRV